MLNYNKYIPFVIAFVAIIIDQLSKEIIRARLAVGDSIPVIDNVLHITHTENTGAAFSLFRDQIGVLTIISILAVVIISYLIVKFQSNFRPVDMLAWGLFLGGTAGNLIDRIIFSRVTDFIDVIAINFPVFNIADICIDTGAFLIIILSLTGSKKANEPGKS